MSDDEINSIEVQLAQIATKVDERARASDKVFSLLCAVGVAVLVQFLVTIYMGGQKIQMLDQLRIDVNNLTQRFDEAGVPRSIRQPNQAQ